MPVSLPTPGETPWGDELNAAITSLDTRLVAVEGGSGAAASSRYVPVLIFNGESNSGGMAENANATGPELAPRPSIKIWDNAGMASFQTLDIGVNNLIGHDRISPAPTLHGWELGLANSVEAGEWWDDTVYLVKTGQGGSIIAEWDVGHAKGYWQTFLNRVRGALPLLRSQGKVPLLYFWWTLGLNDWFDPAAQTPAATWKSKVQAFFVRVRAELGYVPIFIPTWMAAAAMPQAYTDALNEIAAADNMIQIIDSTGATVIQLPNPNHTYHWDYAGMKLLATRLGAASRNFGQHEGYDSRRIDMLAGGGALTPPTPAAPSNTVLPVITGSTSLGGVLTCSTGTWAGSPTGYAYQWKRDGTDIGGETAAAHTVVAADQGRGMTVTVTATNTSGSTSATTAATSVPAASGAPANSTLPAITGATTLGAVLTCSTGTWTNTPTSYAYQWKRGGTNIAGETAATHAIVSADQGTNVTCTVTATNAAGSNSVTTASTAVPAGPQPPSNTALPAISGTVAVGNVLTCSTGTWTNTPTSHAYQWRRNGTNISGEAANTYTIVAADQGTRLTCAVTATNATGSGSATSLPVEVVPTGPVIWVPVAYKDFVGASASSGTLTISASAVPAGANVVDTVDATLPFQFMSEWSATMAQSNALIFLLDDTDSTNMDHVTTGPYASALYHFSGDIFVNYGGGIDGGSYIQTHLVATFPWKVRMMKSGNDVKYSSSPDGVAWTDLYTHVGALAGKTTLYGRVIAADPASGQNVKISRGTWGP